MSLRVASSALALLLLACPRSKPTPEPDPSPDLSGAAGCAAYGPAAKAGEVPPELPELSGLAASRLHPGRFYAHNDSGHGFTLFALATSGEVVGEWTLDGASPQDLEDLAVGPCAPDAVDSCIYLADIGDNLRRRGEVRVHRLAEPETLERDGARTVETFTFRYSDGARDAEALVVHPRSAELSVISKEPGTLGALYPLGLFVAGETREAPRGPTLSLARGEDGQVTGADLHPSGERLLVRTYGHAYEARLAEAPDTRALAEVPLVEVPSGAQPQSEAIAYFADGEGYLLGTEWSGEAIFTVPCR